MRLKFYVSRGIDREVKPQALTVSSALIDAVKLFGDDIEIVHNADFGGVDPDVDIACVWGVMGNASSIVSQYTNRGKHVIMFDKALIRRLGAGGQGTYRVGIDGPSPVKYMMRVPRHFDRFERRRITLQPRVEANILRPKIIYCGSSQKYCDFYGLGDANDYAENVFNQMRKHSIKLSIIYRPKPSWQGFRDIEGSELSRSDKSLKSELSRSSLLVTHGSAAAVESIVFGVPAITLGPCAAQFVAGTVINNETLFNPYYPSDNAKWQWLCNLAYCQWTAEELQSGEAWGFIRNEILEMAK